MAVPEDIQREAFKKDEDKNKILIRCPLCNEYHSDVDVDDHDSPKKALDQAKRQFGAHWSAKHKDSDEGGGGGQSQSQQKQEPPKSEPPQQAQQPQGQPDNSQGGQDQGLTERELIFQSGTEGLKQIKKDRLQNWLDNTHGVGGQTESRILMVFERNESVHSSPHVLYNLLDDELNASASYINTMVEDIFAPEREHEDVLSNQGYTPWFRRSGTSQPSAQMGFSQGGMGMNQGGMGMNQGGMGYQSSGGSMRQQNGYSQGPQQMGGQQGRNMQGDQYTERERELEYALQQEMMGDMEEDQRNALVSGLSDATDEALREMASNVGGLAGTFQRVVDEALVQYASDNPEWVIENMGVLKKVTGIVDGPEGEEEEETRDSQIDDAISAIDNSPDPSQFQQPTQPQQNFQASPPPQQQSAPNQSMNGNMQNQNSGFTPAEETREKMEQTREKGVNETPDAQTEDQSSSGNEQSSQSDEEPEQVAPTPGAKPQGSAAEESRKRKEEFESGNNDSGEEEGFDEIFGDMT